MDIDYIKKTKKAMKQCKSCLRQLMTLFDFYKGWGVCKECARAARRVPKDKESKLNETYFDSIDTEEKAYWLGFLITDGNVSNGYIQINLQERDKMHLEKFRTAIAAQANVKTYINGKYSHAHFGVKSLAMVQKLEQYGIVPQKSLIAKPWNPPIKLAKHYWRGIIDGDGHVSVNRAKQYMRKGHLQKTTRYRVELWGTQEMTQGFANFLTTTIDIPLKISKKVRNIWRICYEGKIQVTRILELLYGNARIALARKEMEARRAIEDYKVIDSKEPDLQNPAQDYEHEFEPDR